MGSPFFGALLQLAAGAYECDETVRELFDRHAARARVGLCFGGAAHFRALSGQAPRVAAHYPSTGGDGDARQAWQAIHADIHEHTQQYDRLFARPIQTNEVARCMPVLGAMLAVSDATRLPLRIFEIGSSAGLVLNFDRYRYSGSSWSWGDPGSPVHLHNRTASGFPAHLDAPLSIVERRGCDLSPLDAADENDANTLLSFVWPDQHDRFQRLRAALALVRTYPVQITRAGGLDWIRAAALPRDDAATVILHTVVTEHMSPHDRDLLADTLAKLGAKARENAPLAWVRMEEGQRGYETTVTLWPRGDERVIARSDGHAQNLQWNPQAK